MGSFGNNTTIGHDVCLDQDMQFSIFVYKFPCLSSVKKNSHMFD